MALPKLGFVGVGRMGTPMSRRLIDAGYEMTVYDPSAKAVETLAGHGATVAASAAALAAECDIILLSLPTPDIVEAVAFGGETPMIDALGAGKTVIDLSTSGLETARLLATRLTERGVDVVDCPVSGGVGGAEAGTLAMMAACPEETFERVRPILEVLGNPFLVGPEPGMGQLTKVMNNLLSVTALAVTSEALVLGKKAGLDPHKMVEVFNASSGQSNASATKIPKFVLTRSFAFGFSLELSVKDARLCLEQAEAFGVPMFVGSATRELLKVAKGRLGGDADLTRIIEPIEEWAGVTVGTSTE